MEAVTESEAVTGTEETADFARVAGMVGDGVLVAGVPADEPAQESPRMDATESLTGLLSLVAPAAGMAGLEAVAAVWAPESCEKLAGAAVPVFRKYPWGARILDFLESGTGAEEAVLVMVVAGMGKATLDAYRLDTAPKADGAQQQRPAPVKTETANAPADLGALVEVHGHANG